MESTTKTKAQENEKLFIAAHFGILLEDALWYHSGNCFSRVAVKTQEAAKIIREKVHGRYINGGMYDGVPLGCITKYEEGGQIWYEVTC